jgi:phenylpyruvate C(3)-methyltransferase
MPVDTAQLFNSAVAAGALSAAMELGLLDRLHHDGVTDLDRFCDEGDLHLPSVSALCRALACFQILEVTSDGASVRPGVMFHAAYDDKGYFLWLVRGYGHLMEHLADFCHRRNRPDDPDDRAFVRRQGRHIALAGRDYGARFVDPCFRAIVDTERFNVVADLGCGSAARLIDLAQSHAHVRGLGVEINTEATALARERVRAAGLADRVHIVQADVMQLNNRAEFDDVDLVCSFFMGHDLWPRARCRRILADLPSVFPSMTRFLLCDTHRSELDTAERMPTFALAFELTHAVMGQQIPSETEWRDLFTEAGWTCVKAQRIGIPFSTIFDLRPMESPCRTS